MLALQDDMDCSHCVTYDGPQVPAALRHYFTARKADYEKSCVCVHIVTFVV